MHRVTRDGMTWTAGSCCRGLFCSTGDTNCVLRITSSASRPSSTRPTQAARPVVWTASWVSVPSKHPHTAQSESCAKLLCRLGRYVYEHFHTTWTTSKNCLAQHIETQTVVDISACREMHKAHRFRWQAYRPWLIGQASFIWPQTPMELKTPNNSVYPQHQGALSNSGLIEHELGTTSPYARAYSSCVPILHLWISKHTAYMIWTCVSNACMRRKFWFWVYSCPSSCAALFQ